MTSAFENGLYGGLLLSIIALALCFIVLGGLTLLIVAIKFVGSSDRGSGKKGEVVYSGGEGASSETSAPVVQAVSTECRLQPSAGDRRYRGRRDRCHKRCHSSIQLGSLRDQVRKKGNSAADRAMAKGFILRKP